MRTCFPVLIFCFYLYLKLCLVREFTYFHIRNVIRLALSDVSSFTGDRVCGVRADLRSLVGHQRMMIFVRWVRCFLPL